MKTRLLIIVTTLVLFSSLFTINEVDALIEAYSLEDLAEKAEFVVIGEVIEISPNVPWYLLFFTDGYDRFLFDVTLSVESDLDGKYGKDTIIFRIHDSREEFGDHIEDEQNFEIGERVLVFIGKKEPDSVMGDAYLVTGVTQGKYLLKDGIAFGTDFPEGISEDELILKIKNMRFSESFVNKTNDNEDKTMLNRTVYGKQWKQNVTEIEIQTNSVYINGTLFGLTSSYIYKPALVIMIIIAIAITLFVVWRVWRKRK